MTFELCKQYLHNLDPPVSSYITTSDSDIVHTHTHTRTHTASPMITVPLEDVNITVLEQMDNIELRCTARGVPAPSITWYRGNVPLTGAETRVMITDSMATSDADGFLFVNSTLLISPSERLDSGMYWCTAENVVLGAPAMDRRLFNVTVNCKDL